MQTAMKHCCRMEDTQRYDCLKEKVSGKHHSSKNHKRGPNQKQLDKDDDIISKAEKNMEHDQPIKHVIKQSTTTSVQKINAQKCCQSGHKAGTSLETKDSKWQSCQKEGQGYIVDRDLAKGIEELCLKRFRKCCLNSSIRNAYYDAVAKAEEEKDDISEE